MPGKHRKHYNPHGYDHPIRQELECGLGWDDCREDCGSCRDAMDLLNMYDSLMDYVIYLERLFKWERGALEYFAARPEWMDNRIPKGDQNEKT